MVWKAAMLFHMSSTTMDRTLTEADIEHAIGYVERSHKAAEQFLTDEVPADANEREVMRLVNCVTRREGKCAYGEAMRSARLNSVRMKVAVETCVQSGRLVWDKSGPGYGFLCLPVHKPAKQHANGNGTV